jgi:hypothetical protein
VPYSITPNAAQYSKNGFIAEVAVWWDVLKCNDGGRLPMMTKPLLAILLLLPLYISAGGLNGMLAQ